MGYNYSNKRMKYEAGEVEMQAEHQIGPGAVAIIERTAFWSMQ